MIVWKLYHKFLGFQYNFWKRASFYFTYREKRNRFRNWSRTFTWRTNCISFAKNKISR
jgi:hypothetical protein